MSADNSHIIRNHFLSTIVKMVFWVLVIWNLFLAVLLYIEIFNMWFGWGDNFPIGWEGGGWQYAKKLNYAISGLIYTIFLIMCMAFAFSTRNRIYTLPLLIVTLPALKVIDYFLSGNLDGNI
ncbi:MAG: hypothetical protein ACT4OY_08645 [Alphaproteobacteria bacterium]